MVYVDKGDIVWSEPHLRRQAIYMGLLRSHAGLLLTFQLLLLLLLQIQGTSKTASRKDSHSILHCIS